MKRKSVLALPILAVATPACGAWVTQSCSRSGPCAATLTHPRLWTSVATIAVLLLGGGTFLGWSTRMLWLVASTARELDRLPRQNLPVLLHEAVNRTGAPRVECLASDAPLAFCARIVRPTIFVTRGLVEHLRADELDAVLLHEKHHSRRYDPLRCAVRRAAADACFYLPLLRWWARHQHEKAELCADRAALQGVGHRPLAGALWALATVSTPRGAAAFHGAAELRAAQLLGDPMPRRQPALSAWLTSGAGLVAALGLIWCLSQVLISLG